jgi:tripartite-type tricarboxylate transporter receptor subunit TctC
MLAERISVTLGQTILVEDVGGGGSTIGTGRVARAAPDGLTLLVHQNALAINATAYPKLPFNAERDLTGIGLINYSPLILVGRNSLPAKTLSELVTWSKQNGAEIRCALGAGVGSMTHLVTAVLAASAGVQIDMIPYRGVQAALSDVIAEHVDVIWTPPEIVVEQLKAGTVKGLAVSSADRMSTLPAVPGVVEMGYSNLEFRFWQGLFAPAHTPEPIIRRLNEAFRLALSDPKVHQLYEAVGSHVYPMEEQTPEAATALLHSEIKRWGDIIRAQKIELSP